MKRRDFVKAMMAASMSAKAVLGQQTAAPTSPSTPAQSPQLAPAAPGPVPWMRGLAEVKPLPMTPLVPDALAPENKRFFSEHQTATLRRLSEILMPPSKGFPGAIDAEAPEFLDFLIGVSPADRQQMYQSGLDRLEAEATQKFKVSFAALDKAQADQLLRPWLRTWMNEHPPSEPYARFINVAHSDIRTATLNSQAWSKAAKAAGRQDEGIGLYWFPVDADIHREGLAPTCKPVQNKRHS